MTADPAPSPQSKIKLLLKLLFSLGLLVFVVQTTGIEKTFQALRGANLLYIPFGVGIYLISQWISSYRWKFLACPLGFYLKTHQYFALYLLGMFYSLFLPGAIGGDVVRMIYLAKAAGKRKREALLTLLAERGVGLVALLLLTGVILLTPNADPIPWMIRWPVLILSAGCVLGYGLIHILPLAPLAKKFPTFELLVQAKVYWQDTPLLIRSIGVSIMVHSCMVAIHVGIATALGITTLSIPYLTAVYGLVGLVSVLPIFFNGIGVREGAYVFLLTITGIPSHTALAFGLYWFLISTLTSLMGGWVFIRGSYGTLALKETSQGNN